MVTGRVRRRARFLPKCAPVRVRLLLAVLVALLAGGCGPGSGLSPRWGSTDGTLAVGLVTSGCAFERSGVRRDVVRALERQSGRRVVVLDGPTSVDDPAVKELAERLVKENPRLAGYDWHERRCTSHDDVLTAIT